MNRTVICVIIILVIAAASGVSLFVIDRSTHKFIALVDAAADARIQGSPEDVERALDELEEYWESHSRLMLMLVNSGHLGDISYNLAKLRELYRSGADDFTAECMGIRAQAELILRRQLPF